jgi:predicted PurR-regulated permease PerM
MTSSPKKTSPPWSNTTKLVVGLTFVAALAGLLIYFRSLLSSLLLAFVVSYLIYPVAAYFCRKLKFPWALSINLIFALVIIVLLGLLTWGGITIVDQMGSLITFLEKTINQLPDTLNQISQMTFSIGPFQFDLKQLDLSTIGTQILNFVQPLVNQAGSTIGTLASGAVSIIGWAFFVLVVSYFVLLESEGRRESLINLELPAYQEDFKRLSDELSRIWNAFLRGQFVIILLTIIAYTILLGILGVRYYYVLAILAGLARFVPYVGPWITWTIYFLVPLFQGYAPFGLTAPVYALLVVGIAILTDTILDNVLVPRVLSGALRLHPASVLIAAIIGASLLGIVGIVLAAPVLATLSLFVKYMIRKMFDKDPWEGFEQSTGANNRQTRIWVTIVALYKKVIDWIRIRTKRGVREQEEKIDQKETK